MQGEFELEFTLDRSKTICAAELSPRLRDCYGTRTELWGPEGNNTSMRCIGPGHLRRRVMEFVRHSIDASVVA